MFNINITEKSIIKFDMTVSGTTGFPDRVRFLIGDNNFKIVLNAYQNDPDNQNEWTVELPPIIDIVKFFKEQVFISVEVFLNGRTIVPFNKSVNMSSIPESPDIKDNELQQKAEINQEQNVELTTSVESNYEELEVLNKTSENTVQTPIKEQESKLVEVFTEIVKEIKKPIIQKEKVKPAEVKPLLKDIAIIKESIKEPIKEETIKPKPKKTYKLKPFNTGLKNIKHDNKSLKDIMVIEDINLPKISISSPTIIQKAGNHVPFKLIKKNVVYK